MVYQIEFTPEGREHLQKLTARQRNMLIAVVRRQLLHQPTLETRNRKPLRPNPVAGYRLRIGNLRVYYDVLDVPESIVLVKAVGVKVGNRIYVGGTEIEL